MTSWGILKLPKSSTLTHHVWSKQMLKYGSVFVNSTSPVVQHKCQNI
jgi:hypothetical protein